MNTYRITIVMPDGSRGLYTGDFIDGFAAVEQILTDFPDVRTVSVICVGKAAL